MCTSLDRRNLLKMTAAGLLVGSLPAIADAPRIAAPAKGKIPVAFLLSQGAVVIDFAGPWEVFHNARDFSRGDAPEEVAPFQLFTVAASTDPIVASGGMRIVPSYSFATAPQPKIVVIPAQGGTTDADLAWIRKVSPGADIVMSVCTGAFVLAATGLLDGQSATTHHSAFDTFAKQFPAIRLERDVRFVDHGHLATSAGLSAGIDLALHVVERYFGVATAQKTAEIMEYQSRGWTDAKLAAIPASKDEPPTNAVGYVCPPCGCAADGKVFPKAGACPACGMALIKKG